VAAGVVELVSVYFAAQGIAMDTKNFGGARLVAVGALKNTLDEFFFEFVNGFFQKNPALDHHSDQGLELIFHNSVLRKNRCAL
jgi:hypothetical protein